MTYPSEQPSRLAVVFRAFCGLALAVAVMTVLAAFVLDFAAREEAIRDAKKAVEKSKRDTRKAESFLEAVQREREKEIK